MNINFLYDIFIHFVKQINLDTFHNINLHFLLTLKILNFYFVFQVMYIIDLFVLKCTDVLFCFNY